MISPDIIFTEQKEKPHWAVVDKETGILVGWITQCGFINGFELVYRSRKDGRFISSGFESLDEAKKEIKRVMGVKS